MKNFNLYLIAFFLFASLLSCKKDTKIAETPKPAVSNNEAAAIVAQTIGTNSGGATFIMGDATSFGANSANKDAQTDSTFTISNTFGTLSYSFSSQYSWNVGLNTSTGRIELKLDFTTTGTANGTHIQVDGSSTGTYTMYGLLATDPYYVLTGNYKRTGTTTISFEGDKTLTSVVDINFTEINFDKTTFKIQSGTATVSLTGTASNGEIFNLNGSIVYASDGTAVLTIGYQTFTINVLEGVVV